MLFGLLVLYFLFLNKWLCVYALKWICLAIGLWRFLRIGF